MEKREKFVAGLWKVKIQIESICCAYLCMGERPCPGLPQMPCASPVDFHSPLLVQVRAGMLSQGPPSVVYLAKMIPPNQRITLFLPSRVVHRWKPDSSLPNQIWREVIPNISLLGLKLESIVVQELLAPISKPTEPETRVTQRQSIKLLKRFRLLPLSEVLDTAMLEAGHLLPWPSSQIQLE